MPRSKRPRRLPRDCLPPAPPCPGVPISRAAAPRAWTITPPALWQRRIFLRLNHGKTMQSSVALVATSCPLLRASGVTHVERGFVASLHVLRPSEPSPAKTLRKSSAQEKRARKMPRRGVAGAFQRGRSRRTSANPLIFIHGDGEFVTIVTNWRTAFHRSRKSTGYEHRFPQQLKPFKRTYRQVVVAHRTNALKR